MAIPDDAVATEIVYRCIGERPTAVRRFTNGVHHYVYEASFAHRASLVVRLTAPDQRFAMVGANTLSAILRPLGVPLPEVLSSGLDDPFPWLLLERFPGTDIGDVLAELSNDAIDRIASGVARAQRCVAKLETGSRFGYAIRAQDAPHRSWNNVVLRHIARSGERIARAGLFDGSHVRSIEASAARMRDELDNIPAVPFLHDATLKNVVVTRDGELSGIVDVDELCFGDPRYPIALTLAASIVRGLSGEYALRLLHHGGYADDRTFRFYVAVYLLDLMSEHGQRFNGNEGESTDAERENILTLYRAALDRFAGSARSNLTDRKGS